MGDEEPFGISELLNQAFLLSKIVKGLRALDLVLNFHGLDTVLDFICLGTNLLCFIENLDVGLFQVADFVLLLLTEAGFLPDHWFVRLHTEFDLGLCTPFH